MARYARNSLLFVREVLGAEPEPWQIEVLRDAYDQGERRISVRSGHGVGKSTVLAWIMLHHALCRYPQKTMVTAPTSSQLWDALWAEYKSWLTRLPPHLNALFDPKQERVELKAKPADSFTSARTSRAESPDALQGVHSENVLLIGDEAAGIPEPVFEAASGSMSGHNAVTIFTGNPTRGSGLFFDTHHKLAKSPKNPNGWWTRKVSCYESRFVSKDYIEDMKARYGENSNAFRVRVLGEFPTTDDDTVIPFELVEASLDRDITGPPIAQPVWGVDCARFGSNRSALAKRRGNVQMEPVKWWRGLDTMQLVGRIKHEWDMTPTEEKPAEINVDVIGIGAGVVDRLRELGLPVRGINVSESPSLGDTYRNLKAELWFRCLAWFKKLDCKMLKQDELILEMTVVKYKFAPNGKLIIESKDDITKRNALKGESPDLADAWMLTFAGDAVSALFGSSRASKRKELPARNVGVA